MIKEIEIKVAASAMVNDEIKVDKLIEQLEEVKGGNIIDIRFEQNLKRYNKKIIIAVSYDKE